MFLPQTLLLRENGGHVLLSQVGEEERPHAPSLCKGSGRLPTAEDACCAWLGTATQKYQRTYPVLCLIFA